MKIKLTKIFGPHSRCQFEATSSRRVVFQILKDRCQHVYKFLSIIEECIPKQTLPRRRNLPWMSRNLVRAMRKRLLNCYKRERNRVVRELRRAKRDCYFRNINPNNTKQFWKTVKLMNKQKTSISTLNRNGMAAKEDSKKANMLNQYFSECFT